jgi:hypothetical protein
VIAVHSVFDGIARDEQVPIEMRHGSVRNNEAVTVVMQHEAPFDFVAVRERSTAARRGASGTFVFVFVFPTYVFVLTGSFPFRLSPREAVAPAGQFLDGAPFFQLGKHFEERTAVGFAKVERAGDFVGGGGIASNF